jgi:hypothetical protein
MAKTKAQDSTSKNWQQFEENWKRGIEPKLLSERVAW